MLKQCCKTHKLESMLDCDTWISDLNNDQMIEQHGHLWHKNIWCMCEKINMTANIISILIFSH